MYEEWSFKSKIVKHPYSYKAKMLTYSRKCVSPPHVRDFVKEGSFFCSQVRSMEGENPLTIHEIYAADCQSRCGIV